MVMHTVKDIPIPADATTQLIPNSYHLLITDPGAMHDGKDIYLTLTFAHGVTMTVYRPGHQPAERRLELLPQLIPRPAPGRGRRFVLASRAISSSRPPSGSGRAWIVALVGDRRSSARWPAPDPPHRARWTRSAPSRRNGSNSAGTASAGT